MHQGEESINVVRRKRAREGWHRERDRRRDLEGGTRREDSGRNRDGEEEDVARGGD